MRVGLLAISVVILFVGTAWACHVDGYGGRDPDRSSVLSYVIIEHGRHLVHEAGHVLGFIPPHQEVSK